MSAARFGSVEGALNRTTPIRTTLLAGCARTDRESASGSMSPKTAIRAMVKRFVVTAQSLRLPNARVNRPPATGARQEKLRRPAGPVERRLGIGVVYVKLCK